MNAIGYALREALVSLRRSGRSAAMSIATIAIAFLTLGGFMLISANLRSFVDEWAAAAEMSVYLRDDVDEGTRQTLANELTAHPSVSAVEFVSKPDALARFKTDFPELGDIVGAGDNPFPASLEVRLRSDPASAGTAEALAGQLTEKPGVADVQYDPRWLSRMLSVAAGIRLAGFAVAAVLVLGAAFTVAAVVRLSLESRHVELDIMQLVGAPFSYIRGPFIAEGTLLGGIGAAFSLLVLWGIFVAMRPQLQEVVSGLARVSEVRFLGVQDALLLMASALGVGGLAGAVTSRAVR